MKERNRKLPSVWYLNLLCTIYKSATGRNHTPLVAFINLWNKQLSGNLYKMQIT